MIFFGVGLIGIYGYIFYCFSKFVIWGLVEFLWGELKLYGIFVFVVYLVDINIL